MAQVFIIAGVFAFLFLQLAAGQDAACTNALMTLTNNIIYNAKIWFWTYHKIN